MYEDAGLSIAHIAKIKGCSYTSIRNRLLAYGVTLRDPAETRRGRSVLPHNEIHKCVLLYENGYSTTEIGEMIGRSSDAVIQRLLKHGVKMRTRSESIRLRFSRRPRKAA